MPATPTADRGQKPPSYKFRDLDVIEEVLAGFFEVGARFATESSPSGIQVRVGSANGRSAADAANDVRLWLNNLDPKEILALHPDRPAPDRQADIGKPTGFEAISHNVTMPMAGDPAASVAAVTFKPVWD